MLNHSELPLGLFVERKEMIDVAAFAAAGYRHLITDADAVLFRHGANEVSLSTDLLLFKWGEYLQVTIGSNNPEKRDYLGRGGRGYYRLENLRELAKGEGKPNPRFITNICDKYDFLPSETVVLDDCLIRGGIAAIGAGALAITLNRQGNDPPYDRAFYLRYRESLLCRDYGIKRLDGQTEDAGDFMLPPQFRKE